jgi:hypothetical protein
MKPGSSYHAHKSPRLDPIMSQAIQIHTLTSSVFNIFMNIKK